MDDIDILSVLNRNYPIAFESVSLFRDAGSTAYTAYSSDEKYFLKITKPAFEDTIKSSAYVQAFLQSERFPVPNVIFTTEGAPFVEMAAEGERRYFILYDYLEGTEVDVNQDAEEIASLLGRLHQVMSGYTGTLITHGKAFYIDRYLHIMKKKAYPRTTAFEEYGNELWNRVKDLPLGFSHGDMHSGNLLRSTDGTLYILDFDTCCRGLPLYDMALLCNQTDYFAFKKNGHQATTKVYERLLPAYTKIHPLSEHEINALNDLIALYHFALQATIIEFMGLESFDDRFFDRQLDWLIQWKEQCESAAFT